MSSTSRIAVTFIACNSVEFRGADGRTRLVVHQRFANHCDLRLNRLSLLPFGILGTLSSSDRGDPVRNAKMEVRALTGVGAEEEVVR